VLLLQRLQHVAVLHLLVGILQASDAPVAGVAGSHARTHSTSRMGRTAAAARPCARTPAACAAALYSAVRCLWCCCTSVLTCQHEQQITNTQSQTQRTASSGG
jgi:hypothetical protein